MTTVETTTLPSNPNPAPVSTTHAPKQPPASPKAAAPDPAPAPAAPAPAPDPAPEAQPTLKRRRQKAKKAKADRKSAPSAEDFEAFGRLAADALARGMTVAERVQELRDMVAAAERVLG